MKFFKKFAFWICFSASSFMLKASDLEITNTLLTYDRDISKFPVLTFTVSWKNAWKNSKNHDAAWIFVKLTDNRGKFWHSKLAANGHEITFNHHNKPGLEIKLSNDRVGLFIQPVSEYRGDINCRVKVLLDTSVLKYNGLNLRSSKVIVQGIEMVYIPSSPFYIGDRDTLSGKYAAFYKVGNISQRELYHIKKEDEIIEIGRAAGNLFYNVDDKSLHGDQTGQVLPSFPKGVKSFYLMKYELSQGQFAAFLNNIDTAFTRMHTINYEAGYYRNKGSITTDSILYKANSSSRPCNYISWDDAMAYADWSGLRPYTELEFSKACRGPAIPTARDFPWGTNSKNRLSRYINMNGDLAYDGAIKESGLTDANREIHGASYYWVMDLAGGVWERVITIGDSTGRLFSGSHGDGMLNEGLANNADWPKGNLEKGFGFRGGGFYNYNRSYNIFNPHSPVEFRPYGSWSGPGREMAYGSRFARTAD